MPISGTDDLDSLILSILSRAAEPLNASAIAKAMLAGRRPRQAPVLR